MTLVYCSLIRDGIAVPEPEEALHLRQVLRKRVGDQVIVTDGLGNGWLAIILEEDKKGVKLAIGEPVDGPQSWGFHLHIGLAPPKSAARLEWFLEKVMELGVNRISLIETERTERLRWRNDRLTRVLIAALKQSGQFILPQLDKEPIGLSKFIEGFPEGDMNKLILTCDWGNLQTLSAVYRPGQDSVVLIGPEGDFTHHEVQYAKVNNFTPVLIGPNRLRTETAGVAVCAQIHVLHEKG